MSGKQQYKNMSDVELVQLSLKNKDYFYYLVKRYEQKILRYIKLNKNVTPEEAEDILQDVFIKVYRNLNSFKQHLKFSSWIYRIAHNEIIDHYHKNKSHKRMASLDIENEDNKNLAEVISDEADLDNIYIIKESADEIKKMLLKLPMKYREVLILRYLEEKSYNEISDILRKPPGTVATLINRAKSKLIKIAKQYGLEANDD